MTHLWHFVVQKIITTAIEVCIWLFMCPELKLHSLLSPCICQCDANLYLYLGRHSAVSPWPLWFVSPQVILCHLCVRSPSLPPSPFGLLNPIVNPFSYVTAATDLQTIDTIAPQNCQIENNLFWWPVDKKYGWSVTLLHQHKYSSNPGVHSIETRVKLCVFKRFMGEKTRWKQDIGNDFRILHRKPLFKPQLRPSISRCKPGSCLVCWQVYHEIVMNTQY